jgi:4-hydroxy-L-threonine phosphate dehydrogenase PdxA
MKIIQRIFQYIDFKSINKSEFERKCGVSNGYLAKMKVRNANIGEDIILKVIENCPDISPNWLIFGKGEMLKTGEKPANQPINNTNTQESTQENSYIIEKIFQQLEEKNKEVKELSKEIGRLEAENDYLREQLAEKNARVELDVEDVTCADVA